MKKVFTGIILVIIVGFAALMVLSQGKMSGVALTILPDNVNLQITDVHFTEVGDPDASWEIGADQATYMKQENLSIFKNVRIRLITSHGVAYVLTAREGTLHTDTGNIEVYGNVVVRSDQNEEIRTEQALYKAEKKEISSEGPVIVENRTMTIEGGGMTLFLRDRRLEMTSHVRARIEGMKHQGEAVKGLHVQKT